MKLKITDYRFLLVVVSLSVVFLMANSWTSAENPVGQITDQLVKYNLANNESYKELESLLSKGPRLSGSKGAQDAVIWAQDKMIEAKFDHVFLQPVMVPHWERGEAEAAQIILSNGKVIDLKVAALGGSVGTNGQWLKANVIEAQNLDEAEKLGNQIKDKILFINQSMNPQSSSSFSEYSKTVGIRYGAAKIAARFGGVAALIRSLSTMPDDDHPHTGIMSYKDAVSKVPALALSTHAANILHENLLKKQELKLQIKTSAQNFPDVESYNVIGEWRGTDLSNEYVVVGGHLDSWDLGPGAHDDAAGTVASMEAIKSMIALGIRPKRTIRVVYFMSEEFGGYGAEEYAKQAKLNHEKHIAAIESDSGFFAPKGFSVSGADTQTLLKIKAYKKYLKQTDATDIHAGGSGTDVEPLEELGAFTLGYNVEEKHYFDLHHSALDTLDRVKIDDFKKGTAALAVMSYLLSIQ